MTVARDGLALLHKSLAYGSDFSARYALRAASFNRSVTVGPEELAGISPRSTGLGFSPVGNADRLDVLLAGSSAATVLVEDMNLRRGDSDSGPVLYSGEIGLREVATRGAGRTIAESTTWVLNAFLLEQPSGLPHGAVLSSAIADVLYEKVIGVIVGAFDGEGYIAYIR